MPSSTNIVIELTAKQHNRCAICQRDFNYKRKKKYDDQNNALLCVDCKTGLEAFSYDHSLIESALIYTKNKWSKLVDMNFERE